MIKKRNSYQKKYTPLIALALAGASFIPTAQAADPCEVVICMMGKVTGQSGGDDCNDAIKSFFDIREYGKHGVFLPWKTADARKAMLGQCKAADPSDISKIIAGFGSIFG